MAAEAEARRRPVAVFRSPGSDAMAHALACRGAGIQQIGSWLANRRLGCHAVVFVDAGSGWLESESAGRIRIVAPSLFLLFPGERHSYGPDEGTNWHEQWVLFEGTLASAFADVGLIDRAHPHVAVERVHGLTGLFARIRRELVQGGRLSGPAAASILHELIVESRRMADRSASNPADGSAQAIAEAIEAEAEGRIDFEALARGFGLSPATLRRRMVASYGLSPKAYQLRLRIDCAKEMLAMEETSIEDIARIVGFDDAYYFSRLFREREGLSPSRFRAENRRR